MNTKKLLSVGILALIALVLIIVPVSARTTRIEVEAIQVNCFYETGDMWVVDGIYHERGGLQSGPRIPLSDEDPIQELDLVYSEINLNLNLKTLKGNGWGSFTGEGFEGIWNGKLTGYEQGAWWDIEGQSIGHGVIPEFEGWELRIEWKSIDPAHYADYAEYCDGATPARVNHSDVTYLIPGL